MEHRWLFFRWPALGGLILLCLGLSGSGQVPPSLAQVGAEGFGPATVQKPSFAIPRINVLEVDVWRRSLENGFLSPVANIPIIPHTLVASDYFSPTEYARQIEHVRHSYTHQRDVLMYFGGVPLHAPHHGLNFNGWTIEDLKHLRSVEGRPFIGLETTDPQNIEWMARRLHEAGYGPLNRIYVRICSEPSEMFYGTEDGTIHGKHHTKCAFVTYQKRFGKASNQLRHLNTQLGLDMRIVFAGTTLEDFNSYLPDSDLYDDLGYDLYVTPENKEKVVAILTQLTRRVPYKPMVIPEFGIASAGPGSSPQWAQETLGDLLMILGKHPGGVGGITVFSVNVAERLPPKRWSWAWTPMMFEMLKEWQLVPRQWRKDGFHRYDPLTYPSGRDVLYMDRANLRIVYRKLAVVNASREALFFEVISQRDGQQWNHRTRNVSFKN